MDKKDLNDYQQHKYDIVLLYLKLFNDYNGVPPEMIQHCVETLDELVDALLDEFNERR